MNAITKYVKENKLEVFCVALITIVAILLRGISLYCRSGVWFDELFSLYFIKQNNVLDVITSLWREDVHMPVYFVFAHIFGNIFGKSALIYKLFGTIISTLTIPLGFYVGKKLFNKETGYFFSILLAINVFFIYYSIEIRFYGMSVLLSLLTTYFQLSFLRENKHKLDLILSTVLLIYTFNIGIIFVFFQFLVGLIYLFISKQKTKEYLKTGLIIVAFSIPAIIFLIRTSVLYNSTLFSFANDIFYFDITSILNFAQVYFSNLFYTNLNNYPWEYNVATLFNFKYFLFGLVPIFLSLFAIFKGIKTNKSVLVLIIPSILFLIFEITMASLGKMGVIARHTIIAFPAIILAVAYGFNSIKHKNLGQILFIILVTIQLSTILIFKNSVIYTHFDLYENLKKDLNSINLTSKDYFFTSETGYVYKIFLENEVTFIDINIDKSCFYNDKKYLERIFGKNITTKINRENKSEILKPYLTTDIPLISLREYLRKTYLNSLQKNQKICILIMTPNEKLILPSENIEQRYKLALYQTLISKINLEVLDEISKHLSFEYVIKDKNNSYIIFVYKK